MTKRGPTVLKLIVLGFIFISCVFSSLLQVEADNKKLQPGSEGPLLQKCLEANREKLYKKAFKLCFKAWQAFNETKKSGAKSPVPEYAILDFLQNSAGMAGQWKHASTYAQILLTKADLPEKTRESVKRELETYKSMLESMQLTKEELDDPETLVTTFQYRSCLPENVKQAAESLAKNSKLHCRYSHRAYHPLLVLPPLREEILSLEPVLMVLIHNLVPPRIIKRFKTMAKTRFKNTVNEPASTKRAKLAWLANDEVPFHFGRLVDAATGLEASDYGSEGYQVVYYEKGGHYVPHVDYSEERFKNQPAGDRIATLLLYLSNVEQGGLTTFPQLKIGVNPEEGAGLLWFNYNKNETSLRESAHAACPLMSGEKWVVNKWFRWRGQFAHKPCAKLQSEPFTLKDLVIANWLQGKQR